MTKRDILAIKLRKEKFYRCIKKNKKKFLADLNKKRNSQELGNLKRKKSKA